MHTYSPCKIKKKKKETLMVAEGPFMNMLLCVAVTALRHTSDSGALAFLLIALISEKKAFQMHHFT